MSHRWYEYKFKNQDLVVRWPAHPTATGDNFMPDCFIIFVKYFREFGVALFYYQLIDRLCLGDLYQTSVLPIAHEPSACAYLGGHRVASAFRNLCLPIRFGGTIFPGFPLRTICIAGQSIK